MLAIACAAIAGCASGAGPTSLAANAYRENNAGAAQTPAAHKNEDVRWFVGLLMKNNQKAFCLPPTVTIGAAANAVRRTVQKYNLSDRITDRETITILAKLYPCPMH
ncbi:MAG TPA: hypothetical protein DEP05_07445 [Betaproteobacteria bacterium]|nr:hypothetical protein [Betaproteobacteria bacterium]